MFEFVKAVYFTIHKRYNRSNRKYSYCNRVFCDCAYLNFQAFAGSEN